jgi:hypothetical protein
MSLLARFRWWREIRGGYWLRMDFTGSCSRSWRRFRTPEEWNFALDTFGDNGWGILSDPPKLQLDLIQLLGTADPIQIKQMVDRPKGPPPQRFP